MTNIHSQKINPCLWFDTNAEEAVNFYTSVFKNSKKLAVSYYADGAPMPKGSILTISFQLLGQNFLALNGGPDFKFTEAVSFIVNCETQEEIDYYWENLSKDGGAEIECGWLKDKFGLSWQIVPPIITELMSSEHPEKSTRVMQAILKMKKLDLKTLKQAYAG
ncbi:MAG TPA: VOC family protein [Daejeonella sp.]|nr:VOC family protein [Daejeonella sp.]